MKKKRLRLAMLAVLGVVGLAAAAVATPSLADSLSQDGSEKAADPKPVYNAQFADPAVTWTGEEYVGVSTGGLAPMATAPTARGPWKHKHGGLERLPKWAKKDGGVWAPAIQHVKGDTYVMYYAAKVSGLADANQRCIGVAVSTKGADARYTPVDSKPLVCPPGADHPGSSQPVTGGVGFIDPSTFTTKGGKNVLMFKSQKPNPGTKLWSLELNDNWTKPTSSSKVLISRAKGQIENPEMIVRGGHYYLIASYDNWANCSYKTVWLRNGSPRTGWKFPSGFPSKTTSKGGTLIKSRDGMCGPGGMTLTKHGDKREFFLHAYRDANGNGKKDSNTRRMYGGELVFSGGIPKLKSFYSPA
ncbi:family 43 glycosylhydrolase [Stackebrandtia nassauensis]|uniref:Glycoside hydrolase family 43 n=1 Tax=Stackebrandtia nassauensis (strain DSM 44728 / CIP 108903 / NRRL B-16338 / NBRC 102104 / LLR-40K-21) TaxID=446470 RepID=D3Q0Y9_STANL|nr:family 43 glycosylhydrolase [Stackebrandtia nassauensis]ADD43739.1 glycoside hydrolase family 43 [Stackebrandtia nassauensis DSM 44728]